MITLPGQMTPGGGSLAPEPPAPDPLPPVARSEVIYLDVQDTPTDAEHAVRAEITEYDAENKVIRRVYMEKARGQD